jgi:hypothetical protein
MPDGVDIYSPPPVTKGRPNSCECGPSTLTSLHRSSTLLSACIWRCGSQVRLSKHKPLSATWGRVGYRRVSGSSTVFREGRHVHTREGN